MFFDKGVCAEPGCVFSRGRVTMAGEYQHARTLCELRNERQAIFTREVNVKHHYVGAQPDCDFLCFCTVGSSDDIAQC